MKKNIGIEYVCTGNGGRSPQAETIAKDYIKEKEIENIVKIYSSGTHAEATANDLFSFPVGFLLEAVEIGVRSGTFKGKGKNIAEEVISDKVATLAAVEQGEKDIMNNVQYCINYLSVDEVAKRNLVLLENGLVPEGHFHQQTIVKDNVDLILPMKQSNADKVKEIYKNGRTRPEIVSICEYVGVDGEISDPFGGTIEDYRKTRDTIEKVVIASIDKVLEKEFHWSNNWVLNP